MISTGSLAAFSASVIPNLQRPGSGLPVQAAAFRRPADSGTATKAAVPGTAAGPLPAPGRLTPRGSLLDLSV